MLPRSCKELHRCQRRSLSVQDGARKNLRYDLSVQALAGIGHPFLLLGDQPTTLPPRPSRPTMRRGLDESSLFIDVSLIALVSGPVSPLLQHGLDTPDHSPQLSRDCSAFQRQALTEMTAKVRRNMIERKDGEKYVSQRKRRF